MMENNQENLEKEIYMKLARLCARSEQCSPDLVRKIRELGGSSFQEENILEKLQKEGFLSDERYVRAYVQEKFRINRWGRVKMRYYLKMKGLGEAIIEAGLNELEEDEYHKLLVKTMKEKAKSVKTGNRFEKMGQIIRFTQSRGFEPELIHRYLNEVGS
jgi:regulatory protein